MPLNSGKHIQPRLDYLLVNFMGLEYHIFPSSNNLRDIAQWNLSKNCRLRKDECYFIEWSILAFLFFIMIRNIAVQSNEYPPQIINYPSVLQSYTLFFSPSTCSKTYGKRIFYFYNKTKIALSSPHPTSDGIFEGKRDSTVIFFNVLFFS